MDHETLNNLLDKAEQKGTLRYAAIRAQGPGGQNVNKVSTAIELRLDLSKPVFEDGLRQRLEQRLKNRISKEGVLVIKSQTERTQLANKQAARMRLINLIEDALRDHKPRVPTRPSRAAKRKRLDSKSRVGEKKQLRRKVDY